MMESKEIMHEVFHEFNNSPKSAESHKEHIQCIRNLLESMGVTSNGNNIVDNDSLEEIKKDIVYLSYIASLKNKQTSYIKKWNYSLNQETTEITNQEIINVVFAITRYLMINKDRKSIAALDNMVATIGDATLSYYFLANGLSVTGKNHDRHILSILDSSNIQAINALLKLPYYKGKAIDIITARGKFKEEQSYAMVRRKLL